uniref:Cystatin domain-containing protein n=1 Tax=Periophthalmus magnuspinnatus TaxID=409849 RepID=A0A3B3Z6J6_9GOBI
MLVLLLVCLPLCSVVTGQIMTGQPRPVSTRSEKVWRAARFAVGEFNNALSQQPFTYKILNVTSAKVQVVAGVNYIIEVQLGRVCKSSLLQKCHGKSHPKLLCTFTVTEIPWEGKRFVYRRICKP